MPPVTPEQLAALEPYIAGAKADERGEVEMYCPTHPDTRRSASVNVEKGVWYCHAGCGGSSVRQLVLAADSWVPPDGRVEQTRLPVASTNGRKITIPDVKHWHNRLRREKPIHRRLQRDRGLTMETIRKAMIGWDGRHYKIPVFGPRRRLWNVRNYDPDATNGRSKIWNTKGMGEARLYPFGVLEKAKLGEPILLCEGEWDTLLALQYRVRGVTRTDGAGKPWHDEWTEHFAGCPVYLCHDADRAGSSSDAEAADALSEVTEVYQCYLPFSEKESGGHDLSDYLLMFRIGKRRKMLLDLIESATRRT